MTADALLQALMQTQGSGPTLLAVVVALLWQISSNAKRGFGTVQRLGKRIGDLERADDRIELRVWQLEQLLRAEEVAVPPWPAPRPPRDDVDDYDDDPVTAEAPRVSVPAIPKLPDSLRRTPR